MYVYIQMEKINIDTRKCKYIYIWTDRQEEEMISI